MELRLLGPVEVWAGGHRFAGLGTTQQRAVLAALAVDAGRPVMLATLVDRVWDEAPPAGTRPALYAHITRIRQALHQAGAQRQAGPVRRAGGYVLEVDPDQVDLHRFRRMVAAARDGDRSDAERARLLREALSLWRGPPLADLTSQWAARMRESWSQQRLDVVVAWGQAELRLGRHDEVIGPVRDQVADHPLAEPLVAVLMRALVAAGRDAEALDHYATTRTRLVEDLGAEPGPELRAVHEAVLRGELDRSSPAELTPPGGGGSRPVPAQLPSTVRGFTGRDTELRELDDLLTGPADKPSTVLISAVSGTAGVGKTALAVHWGHRVADQFPDGQLYVNLRGYDPGERIMEPAAAVRGFLDALGVPPERIPADLHAQTALYRSLLAGKRVLVVLDNAKDAEHARWLLPGGPPAVAVVTSRSQLTPLVAVDGAHPLTLDLLTTGEARELLARRLGPGRVAAEPEAVEQVIAACAQLPLALAVAAARAQQSRFPLATLAAHLTDAGRRLDTLDAGDPTTRVDAVFAWSYAGLIPSAARLFRLLGLHPGPDISASAAASLAGHSLPETRRLLAELTRASLTAEHTPGRYGLHDLLAAYATNLTHTHDTPIQQRAATTRLLDHYTHTAHAADRLLHPTREPILLPLAPLAPGTSPEQPDGHQPAMAWLEAEHAVLLAAVRLAADREHGTHAWQLAWAVDTFLDRRAHWPDLAGAWEAALLAARCLANPPRAYAHRRLAASLTLLGRHDDAHTHFERALHLYSRAADRVGEARTHNGLGRLWEVQGRPEQALSHAQHALTLLQAVGDHRGQALALNAVGWYHALLGDHTMALTYCGQALTLHQQTADRQGQAHTWDSLGYAHHHLNHHAQATDCYHDALTLYRDLGDRYYEATTLTRLGDTYDAAGNLDAARTAWTHALNILTDLDHPDAATIRAKLATLDHSPPPQPGISPPPA